METINISTKCVKCGEDLVVKVNPSAIDPLLLAPDIRGNVRPTSLPYRYVISSEEIKRFIIDKVHMYSPNTKLEISVKYCEKKRRKDREPHRSYATFLIAFSHHVIKDYKENGWFERLGEENGRAFIIKELYVNLINKWAYDPKQIDEWRKSYKKLELLEEGLGMTESFINEIKEFSVPKSTRPTANEESWVFFMASPEKILMDFFTNPESNSIIGKLDVNDIVQISKDIVEYHITLDPYNVAVKENPHVRQILNGEAKI